MNRVSWVHQRQNRKDPRVGSKRFEPGGIQGSCGVDKGETETGRYKIFVQDADRSGNLLIGNVTPFQGIIFGNHVDCAD